MYYVVIYIETALEFQKYFRTLYGHDVGLVSNGNNVYLNFGTKLITERI
jgi:hypothetical protein